MIEAHLCAAKGIDFDWLEREILKAYHARKADAIEIDACCHGRHHPSSFAEKSNNKRPALCSYERIKASNYSRPISTSDLDLTSRRRAPRPSLIGGSNGGGGKTTPFRGAMERRALRPSRSKAASNSWNLSTRVPPGRSSPISLQITFIGKCWAGAEIYPPPDISSQSCRQACRKRVAST